VLPKLGIIVFLNGFGKSGNISTDTGVSDNISLMVSITSLAASNGLGIPNLSALNSNILWTSLEILYGLNSPSIKELNALRSPLLTIISSICSSDKPNAWAAFISLYNPLLISNNASLASIYASTTSSGVVTPPFKVLLAKILLAALTPSL